MHFFESHSGRHRTVCLASVPRFGGPINIPSLIFCVTHIWEIIPHIFESKAGFIHTFHKVFHEAQLCVQTGADKFSPEEQEED